MDASLAGRAVLLSFKGVPGLGEGGRRSEGLRASSLGRSHEAKWPPKPRESQLCRALPALAPKAAKVGQHPCAGRAARPVLPLCSQGSPVLRRTGGRASSWQGGDWGEKTMGKEGTKTPLQSRALLSALACLTGKPELQAAPECTEGEMAWLEGAWLLFPCGIACQKIAQHPDPPHGYLIHRCGLGLGEGQRHLGGEKLLVHPGR